MKLSISLGQRRGKQSQDRKRRSLLVEPTSDDEDDCPQTVIHGKSEPASMPNEQKSGRFALASLLVILFGALLVSVQQIGCTAVDQSTLPVGNLTASLLPVSSNSTTTDSSASLQDSTTTMGTTSDDSLEETEEDITEPSSSSGSRLDSEPEESTTESSQPLTKLLVDSAGQAADQLVGRLRGSESEIEAEETPTEPDRRRNSDTQVQGEANSSSSIDTEQLRLAFDTYAKWRHAGDDFIELFSRKLLPVIMEHGYDVDAQTVGGLLQVFNGIRALKPWALKLLDASAKISPGILVGTQSDFGDFDECLNIRADDPSGLGIMGEIDQLTGLPRSTLVGKYCLADIEFPKPPRERLPTRNEELQTDYAAIELRRPLLNFSETAAYKDTIFVETGNFFHMLYVDPLRVGVCLTNKIDADSFAQVFNKLFDEFKVTINFRGRCVTKYDKPVWTLQQRISAHVILIVCSLVFLSTGFDILHKRWHRLPGLGATTGLSHLDLDGALNKYRPVLTAFSIIRNTKRLMKPQQAIRQKVQPLQLTDPILSAQSSSPSLTSSTASSPCTDRRSSLASSDANLIGNDRCDLLVSSINNKTGNLLSIDMVRPAQILKQSESKSQQQPEADLMCLHGIRVITMTWMIVNHTYLFGGFFVLWAHRRLIDIAEWPKSVSFQLVLNGWLTVETYFFLSAAIIVLNVMPLMKSKRFSYLPYIFHRLVRLLPAYTGLVALNFLWPLISSGPVWLVKGKSFIQTPCENYLWTNFLFINNWIWPEKQCMVHTWFLSADFQLYLLAPIVVYLLYRRPAFGHTVNILIAILASVLSGFVIYANKLMPTTLINKLEFDSIKQQLSYSYFATYQHMGPYCLGILVGYLLHKRPHMRLPKHLTWLLWILLPPLSFTTLLLTYLWNGAYNEPQLINPSPLVSALYVAIHRTIWTSLTAWIVFSCATGRAKLMSSFLSHSIALNLRHTIEWTDTNILWEACGNFIASTLVGYFLNIAFESPMINLEQVIFGRPAARQQSDGETDKSKVYQSRDRAFLRPQADGCKLSRTDSDEHLANSSRSASLSNDEQVSSSVAEVDGSLANLDDDHQMELPRQPRATQRHLASHQQSSPSPRYQATPGSGLYSTLAQVRSQQAASPRIGRYATLQRNSRRLAQVHENVWPESVYQTLSRDCSRREPALNQPQTNSRRLDGRRHNRYNTLTGAGSREWRGLVNDCAWSAYMSEMPLSAKTQSELATEKLGEKHLTRLQGSHWPQAGLMIPRVDSSTLKRQQKLARPGESQARKATSILEEPALPVAAETDEEI